jgi:hypothetical protein
MAISTKQREKLIRTVNKALGRNALDRLYDVLGVTDYNRFQELLTTGQIAMHNDGYIGFCCDTPEGWTTECFGGPKISAK